MADVFKRYKLLDELDDRPDVISWCKRQVQWLDDDTREIVPLARYGTIDEILQRKGTVSMSVGKDNCPSVHVSVPGRNMGYTGRAGDDPWDALRLTLKVMSDTSYRLYDGACDDCTYIGTFPLRQVRKDSSDREVGWADVYLSCGRDDGYIVRYGDWENFSTTPNASTHVFGAFTNLY